MSGETIFISNDQIVRDQERLSQALEYKFDQNVSLSGTIELPCIPSFLELYVYKLETLIKALGRSCQSDHLDFYRFMIADHLVQGFAKAPDTGLRIIFSGKGTEALRIKIETVSQTLDEKYQEWTQVREPPLFGQHPDAKVMDLLRTFSPDQAPILDLGAGTGRNTIPIARKGYNIDAVELTSVFAHQLNEVVKNENLTVKVMQNDILNPDFFLPKNHYCYVFASEVISTHIRSLEQLKEILRLISDCLRVDGVFLFDVFMPLNDYIPEEKVRELGQVNWCCIFTPGEITEILEEFSLEIISNESALEYEKNHQPSDAFPRNSWFTKWAQGYNIFALTDEEKPPIELRWIVCRPRP